MSEQKPRFIRKALTAAICSAMLAACGGGGSDDTTESSSGDTTSGGTTTSSGGTDVSGLSMPQQVAVVGADSGDTTASFKRAAFTASAFNDGGTDYDNAEQHFHIWHPALDPIESVNSILCFVEQLNASDMVNEGAYLALVDNGKCVQGNESGGSSTGDQSSGSDNAPEYVEAIVNVTRADDESDMIVNFWLPEMETGGNGDMGAIKAKAVVSESPSDTKPFGEFHLSFGMYTDVTSTTTTGGGELATVTNSGGEAGFTLYESNEAREMEIPEVGTVLISSVRRASVFSSADETTGSAVTQEILSFTNSEGVELNPPGDDFDGTAYGLAFDQTNVLVRMGGDFSDFSTETDTEDACLARDDYREAVWRYQLFDADSGAAVELQSGFPFRYATDSENAEDYDGFGWVGYWGVWADGNSQLVDGQTIVQETWGDEEADPVYYTVNVAPGRLIKNTTETLALTSESEDDIVGVEFFYWDELAYDSSYDEWILEYLAAGDSRLPDGGSAGFHKTYGVSNSEGGGPNETSLDPTIAITFEYDDASIHMWSNQLGGGVQYKNGASNITFFREEFVDGGETGTGELLESGTASLLCYNECPVGTLGLEELVPESGDSWESVFDSGIDWENHDNNAAIQYTFSSSGDNAMTLVRTSNSEPVVFADGMSQSDLQNSNFSWGVHSGPLVTDAYASVLADNPWIMWEDPTAVPEFYVWETGPNEWNKLTTVTDSSGVTASFDKPLEFRYTHATANDRNVTEGNSSPYDGQVFLMGYGGDDLWGIPHESIGGSEDDEHNRYYPIFNLADGTAMGPSDSSPEYVVKAIDIEQKMRMNTLSDCASLSVSDLTEPPSALTDAYDVDIGTMPEVDDSPAVIGGETQTGDTESEADA